MSEKILIFGGTTEGRILAEFCAENRISVSVSVATEYGASLLPQSSFVNILVGRLDAEKIENLICENGFSLVVDATHPYAEEATENIRTACKKACAEYIRLLRDECVEVCGETVSSAEEMISLLEKTDDIILSTLGSKELPVFAKLEDIGRRLWVRVLPAPGIEDYCVSLGLDREHIITGKGPFSREENIMHIRQSGAGVLVTKESGNAGGYLDKINAAEECGIRTITIKRPRETGLCADEVKRIIISRRGERS